MTLPHSLQLERRSITEKRSWNVFLRETYCNEKRPLLMALPVLTPSLAQRLHEVQNALRISAMTYLQQQEGNPYRIALQQFGHAMAFRTANVQDLDAFNRIIGMQTTDLPLLNAMVGFF